MTTMWCTNCTWCETSGISWWKSWWSLTLTCLNEPTVCARVTAAAVVFEFVVVLSSTTQMGNCVWFPVVILRMPSASTEVAIHGCFFWQMRPNSWCPVHSQEVPGRNVVNTPWLKKAAIRGRMFGSFIVPRRNELLERGSINQVFSKPFKRGSVRPSALLNSSSPISQPIGVKSWYVFCGKEGRPNIVPKFVLLHIARRSTTAPVEVNRNKRSKNQSALRCKAINSKHFWVKDRKGPWKLKEESGSAMFFGIYDQFPGPK